MWRTSSGDRVLTEKERAVFAYGLSYISMVYEDRDSDGYKEAVIPPLSFLDLSYGQRMVVLADAAEAIYKPEISPPELNAFNEGAIADVISSISYDVEDDHRLGFARYYTHKIVGLGYEYGMKPLKSRRTKKWYLSVIDQMKERIFWDADYEMGSKYRELYANDPIAIANLASAGYFHITPREFSRSEVRQADKRIQELMFGNTHKSDRTTT